MLVGERGVSDALRLLPVVPDPDDEEEDLRWDLQATRRALAVFSSEDIAVLRVGRSIAAISAMLLSVSQSTHTV